MKFALWKEWPRPAAIASSLALGALDGSHTALAAKHRIPRSADPILLGSPARGIGRASTRRRPAKRANPSCRRTRLTPSRTGHGATMRESSPMCPARLRGVRRRLPRTLGPPPPSSARLSALAIAGCGKSAHSRRRSRSRGDAPTPKMRRSLRPLESRPPPRPASGAAERPGASISRFPRDARPDLCEPPRPAGRAPISAFRCNSRDSASNRSGRSRDGV